MTVYLIRHARAVDGSEDSIRPLSAQGLEQVGRLAQFLKGNGVLRAGEFWHSPLTRARQTAALLAEGLGRHTPLREVPGLEPDKDPAIMAAQLNSSPRSLALVGHEPHLSALGSLLIRRVPWPPVFIMPTCAALALERVGEGSSAGWITLWHLAPGLLGLE